MYIPQAEVIECGWCDMPERGHLDASACRRGVGGGALPRRDVRGAAGAARGGLPLVRGGGGAGRQAAAPAPQARAKGESCRVLSQGLEKKGVEGEIPALQT